MRNVIVFLRCMYIYIYITCHFQSYDVFSSLSYLLHKFEKELDIYHKVCVKVYHKVSEPGTRRTGCLPNEEKCRNTAETE